eukprot:TRINITY_DN3108_c0_g2_i2.p1 TRINITY_DN3108_c0_g2~~TRINITY_DN3108_c0_g2_i2.p1  ORF type:complete len:149 (-),score=38.53 TRINITY_DN3108_c0_g2_i2:393-839(-)
MQFLHNNNIIHRDLKTDNMLIVSLSIGSTVRAKVSDFGTSRMVGSDEVQQLTTAIGTPSFMAPETMDKGSPYSLPSDVFSFAVLLWSLWNESEPYLEFKTVFSVYSFVQSGKRLPFDEKCCFKEIIESSWKQNPQERPTFNELVKKLS